MVAPIPIAHLQSIFGERDNGRVLADLICAKGELARLQHATIDREPTPYEDTRWSIAEQQIEDCRDELRGMIEEQTGLEWSALLAAMQ